MKINIEICEKCQYYFRRVSVNFGNRETTTQTVAYRGKRNEELNKTLQENPTARVYKDYRFCVRDECLYKLEQLVLNEGENDSAEHK